MNKPLVSVIVPIYNAEKYLAETIESIINQTYHNLEILLINHNSTDTSISIIDHYKKSDNRIKVINLDINKGGPAYPRNIGIENSSGEYIAFLDSDDVWLPEKIEKQVNILSKLDDIDIVHSLAYIIDIKGKIKGVFNNQKTFKKLNSFMSKLNILCVSNYININTVLMRNDFKIRFREDVNLIALEDWTFWIENIYSGKKDYLIDDKLIKYRIDINSLSDRRNDTLYRKAFYMNSLLLNEKIISLKRFVFNSFFYLIKISIKNL